MRIRRYEAALLILAVFLLVLIVAVFYYQVAGLRARVDGLEMLIRALHNLGGTT